MKCKHFSLYRTFLGLKSAVKNRKKKISGISVQSSSVEMENGLLVFCLDFCLKKSNHNVSPLLEYLNNISNCVQFRLQSVQIKLSH